MRADLHGAGPRVQGNVRWRPGTRSASPARIDRREPCSGCGSLPAEASRCIRRRRPAGRGAYRGRLHVATLPSQVRSSRWLKETGARIPSLTVGGVRTSLGAIAMLVVLVACGNPIGGSGTPAASASSVAVKVGDLPSGMHRCDLSGDINSYLKKIQTSDPTTYASTSTHWKDAQAGGATAADVEFYTDSTARCTGLESNGSQIGSATYKLAVNFVFQFKDEASAASGYTSESIFGFSVSQLKTSQIPVVEGAATGL